MKQQQVEEETEEKEKGTEADVEKDETTTQDNCHSCLATTLATRTLTTCYSITWTAVAAALLYFTFPLISCAICPLCGLWEDSARRRKRHR